jgi:hypothetical protein
MTRSDNVYGLDRVTQLQFSGTAACTSTDINAGNCLTYTYDGDR